MNTMPTDQCLESRKNPIFKDIRLQSVICFFLLFIISVTAICFVITKKRQRKATKKSIAREVAE